MLFHMLVFRDTPVYKQTQSCNYDHNILYQERWNFLMKLHTVIYRENYKKD